MAAAGGLAALLLLTGCGPAAPVQSSTAPPRPNLPPSSSTSAGTGPITTSVPARPSTGGPTTDPGQVPTPTPPTSPSVPGCGPVPATPITSAPGSGLTVALTFDDGASGDMLAIATLLRSKGVNAATFFDTGAMDEAHPEVVRRVAGMGFLIGNHSWEHQYPSAVTGGWTRGYLTEQMRRTSVQIRELTGQRTCFFRPPGGYLMNVVPAGSQEGLSTVLWSVDSRDWAAPGRPDPAYVSRIVANATDLTHGDGRHPIVLMHAGKASHEPESQVSSYRGNTVVALPAVIDWYRTHGYQFVDLAGRS